MRLIDLDAFREEYDLREHCEDCGRRNKKACDYPSYSARDFCGWLDDVPTVDAVPLDKLCDWLAGVEAGNQSICYECSGSFDAPCPDEYELCHDPQAWKRHIRAWMQKEGLNAAD